MHRQTGRQTDRQTNRKTDTAATHVLAKIPILTGQKGQKNKKNACEQGNKRIFVNKETTECL